MAAMIQRRAAAAGYTAAQVDLLGGHSLRSGSSPRRSAPAPTPSRGRPVPRSEDARGLRPGVRAPGRQRGAEIGPVTTPVTSAGTAKPLSALTQAGYAADWALFADWCAATSVRLRSVEVARRSDPGRLRQGSIRGRPAQHSSVCHCERELPPLRPAAGTATESAHICSWGSAICLVEVAQEGCANRWTSRTWRRLDMGQLSAAPTTFTPAIPISAPSGVRSYPLTVM